MTDIKLLSKLNRWLIPMVSNQRKFNYKVGDLVEVGKRLCLILKISKHKNEIQRKVLVRWIGEKKNYWIGCNTFLELID